MTTELDPTPKAGVYKHYKGGLYQFNNIAGSSDDKTPTLAENTVMVVYTCLYTSKGGPFVRTRTLWSWNESVKWPDGKMRARFVYLGTGAGKLPDGP